MTGGRSEGLPTCQSFMWFLTNIILFSVLNKTPSLSEGLPTVLTYVESVSKINYPVILRLEGIMYTFSHC